MSQIANLNSKPGVSRNGTAPDLFEKARSAGRDDRQLFELFRTLAKEAGRDDLELEFRRRSQGDSAPLHTQVFPALDVPATSPAASTRHQEACNLVRDGKLEDAVNAFRDVIRSDPRYADAHCNMGVALARLKRLPEAEAAFRCAIRLDPVNGTAYVNLTTCFLQQSKLPEAEEWGRQAVQLKPDHGEAHRLLGCALDAMKKYEQAEEALASAVRLAPGNAEAHQRYGSVLARREKRKEAEAAQREAVRLNPKLVPAWSGLASALSDQDKFTEAADALREALRLEPGSADLHNSLGVAMASVEKFPEAESEYRQALRLNADLASAHSNLGNTLRSLGRLDDAEASLREALQRRPNYPEAHNNLGIVHIQKGQHDVGLQCYDEALRMAPNYPEAHLNKALALLGNGDFARGFPEYEWRWKVRPSRHSIPPGPRWDGSPLKDRPLLITTEQGLGDTIHFIRYAALAKARGARVIFECPAALASLVETCPGIDQVAVKGASKVTYDTHVPLLSLPGIFGVPPDVATAPIPYFRAVPERIEYWHTELAALKGLRIGIAWQGSKVHKGDRLRSVSLARFRSLQIPGVTLVSLQKGPGSEQLTDGSAVGMEALDLGSRTAPEMIDTAAVIMNLDLVISVDTAIVHLAGALGRPVWVALPFASDWRWLRQREDSPWYPSLRLFRQTAHSDWDGVFDRLRQALGEFVSAREAAA